MCWLTIITIVIIIAIIIGVIIKNIQQQDKLKFIKNNSIAISGVTKDDVVTQDAVSLTVDWHADVRVQETKNLCLKHSTNEILEDIKYDVELVISHAFRVYFSKLTSKDILNHEEEHFKKLADLISENIDKADVTLLVFNLHNLTYNIEDKTKEIKEFTPVGLDANSQWSHW
jgi:hypothetical protein